MDRTRELPPGAESTGVGVTRSAERADAGARDRARWVMWRRRHVNARTVVALIALSSLVLPGVAAIVEAVL
jgi:hypothetical protein